MTVSACSSSCLFFADCVFIRTRRDVHVRDVHDVAVLFTRVFTFAVPLSPKNVVF